MGTKRIELPSEAVRLHVIFVTGPRRSGTTITGRILAHETGRVYIDELGFATSNLERLKQLVAQRQPCVVQAPAMAPRLLELPADWLIVMLWRPLEEIRRSCKRIGLPVIQDDLSRQYRKRFFQYYKRGDTLTAEVIYRVWRAEQRPRLPYSLDLHYKALSSHSWFVPARLRRDFQIKQIRSAVEVSKDDVRACPPCLCDKPGYCERHKRKKTPHLFRLCQTRPEYRALWDKQCPDSTSSS